MDDYEGKHHKMVKVYLTDVERDLLDREVASTGAKMSDWVRTAIRSRLGLRVSGDAKH